MPVASEPKNIRLSGPEWEPPGLAAAPPMERLDYWRELARIAFGVKREEIRKGIGKSGRKLKAVKPSSRPDGATGPPLIPHEETSRTYRLLATHADPNGATLFWRGHGQKSWQTILGYHAYKHGPRALPVRNTIGISRAGANRARREAFAWWEARQGAKAKVGGGLKPGTVGRVKVLKPGEKPDPGSKKIQVYTTRGGKPKGATGPPALPPKPPKVRMPRIVADAMEKARLAAEAKARAEEEARVKREKAERRKAEKLARMKAQARAEAAEIDRRFAARRADEARRLEAARVGAIRGAPVTAEDLAALREAMQVPEGGPSIKNRVAAEWAAARMSPTATPVKKHGMAAAEEMHSLTVEGITYRFPAPDLDDVERVGQVGATFRNAATGVHALPAGLRRDTREVVLASGANDKDHLWKIRYNNPHHVSNATGGDGDVVVYNRGAATTSTLAHEMGHNLAFARYNDTHPDPGSDYAAAMASAEPPVTEYARNSPAEDFADAVRMYVLEPERLQSIAPLRFKVVRRMIEERTYGG